MRDQERDRYYTELAAAFVRGERPDLEAAGARELIERGLEEGLDLHRFKRAEPLLPRVRKVLGVVQGFAPASLLDVGSGRGAFLWPLLDSMPRLEVIAVDTSAYRMRAIRSVRRGGLARLSPSRMDATRLALASEAVEGVTILELLEHLQRPELAAREALRVARRFVVASVPSKEDDNPQHIRRFTAADLERLFAAGARKVDCGYVLNHIVALVTR